MEAQLREPQATSFTKSSNFYQSGQASRPRANQSLSSCQTKPTASSANGTSATFTVSKTEMTQLIGHPVDEDDPEGWQPIYFNCAEQFAMMYCKAGRFHDSQTQKRILATNDPKEQKKQAGKPMGSNPTAGMKSRAMSCWLKILPSLARTRN